MGLTLLTPPGEEPITLADAKLHLRVDHTDEDLLITGLIATARQAAEARTGRALVTQQWRQTLDAWPVDGVIELSWPPLVSVQSVSYLDTAGVRQTLSAPAYAVTTDTLVGTVAPAYDTDWPDCRVVSGSIRIDHTAGYGNAAAVPQQVKAWMLLAIATWYAQREVVIGSGTLQPAELPRAFWDGLLDPYRIPAI